MGAIDIRFSLKDEELRKLLRVRYLDSRDAELYMPDNPKVLWEQIKELRDKINELEKYFGIVFDIEKKYVKFEK